MRRSLVTGLWSPTRLRLAVQLPLAPATHQVPSHVCCVMCLMDCAGYGLREALVDCMISHSHEAPVSHRLLLVVHHAVLTRGAHADPVTKQWLLDSLDPVFGLPPVTRLSWATCTRLIEEHGGVPVKWCAPVLMGGRLVCLTLQPGPRLLETCLATCAIALMMHVAGVIASSDVTPDGTLGAGLVKSRQPSLGPGARQACSQQQALRGIPSSGLGSLPVL